MIFSYKHIPIFHLDCGLTRTTLKGLRREKRFLKQVLHIIVPEIKHNRNRLCQALVVFNDPQVTTIIISMSCPELLSWFSFKFNQVYVPVQICDNCRHSLYQSWLTKHQGTSDISLFFLFIKTCRIRHWLLKVGSDLWLAVWKCASLHPTPHWLHCTTPNYICHKYFEYQGRPHAHKKDSI